MNEERMLAVASAIRKLPHDKKEWKEGEFSLDLSLENWADENRPTHFNMSSWITFPYEDDNETGECCTSACVAGWTCAIFPEEVHIRYIQKAAASILGLNDSESTALFLPSIAAWNKNYHLGSITPKMTARVMEECVRKDVVFSSMITDIWKRVFLEAVESGEMD